jgi:molybdopterin converting factor small subunit
MPTVVIPPLLQYLTNGQDRVVVAGGTVAEVIAHLDAAYPGIAGRLVEHGVLKPSLAVVIDAQVSRRGLDESVAEASEVHFIAALAGG